MGGIGNVKGKARKRQQPLTLNFTVAKAELSDVSLSLFKLLR